MDIILFRLSFRQPGMKQKEIDLFILVRVGREWLKRIFLRQQFP